MPGARSSKMMTKISPLLSILMTIAIATVIVVPFFDLVSNIPRAAADLMAPRDCPEYPDNDPCLQFWLSIACPPDYYECPPCPSPSTPASCDSPAPQPTIQNYTGFIKTNQTEEPAEKPSDFCDPGLKTLYFVIATILTVVFMGVNYTVQRDDIKGGTSATKFRLFWIALATSAVALLFDAFDKACGSEPDYSKWIKFGISVVGAGVSLDLAWRKYVAKRNEERKKKFYKHDVNKHGGSQDTVTTGSSGASNNPSLRSTHTSEAD